jgi:hypothetical protein
MPNKLLEIVCPIFKDKVQIMASSFLLDSDSFYTFFRIDNVGHCLFPHSLFCFVLFFFFFFVNSNYQIDICLIVLYIFYIMPLIRSSLFIKLQTMASSFLFFEFKLSN